MGVVGVTVENIGVSYPNGIPAPVFDAQPVLDEAITSGGVAAATSGTVPAAATGGRSLIWRIATDTAIWVAFGTAPVAAAGAGRFIPAGGVFECRANPGDKASVIDA